MSGLGVIVIRGAGGSASNAGDFPFPFLLESEFDIDCRGSQTTFGRFLRFSSCSSYTSLGSRLISSSISESQNGNKLTYCSNRTLTPWAYFENRGASFTRWLFIRSLTHCGSEDLLGP